MQKDSCRKSQLAFLMASLPFDWLLGGQAEAEAEDSAIGWVRRESLGLA